MVHHWFKFVHYEYISFLCNFSITENNYTFIFHLFSSDLLCNPHIKLQIICQFHFFPPSVLTFLSGLITYQVHYYKTVPLECLVLCPVLGPLFPEFCILLYFCFILHFDRTYPPLDSQEGVQRSCTDATFTFA